MPRVRTCAVVGLGEAGAQYAAALAEAGHTVRATDPAEQPTPAGVERVASIEEAVRQADLVLVLTGAALAPRICESALPHLAPGTCYADLTSASPGVMRELGDRVTAAGAHFADVAILGPVPWYGAQTPVAISGSGGPTIASVLSGVGASVDLLDEPPGAAMARKLLRSVFMKGLASIINEAVDAGRASGNEEWIRDQIAAQLAGDGQAVIDRLVRGTHNHAQRRAHEMAQAASYLTDLDVPATMTAAAVRTHERIRDTQTTG